MIKGHGGNIYALANRLGCRPFDIIDMSSNVNPLGPPKGLFAFLTENIEAATVLPEVDAECAALSFGKHYDIASENILAGSGTTEFIYMIPEALNSKRALILGPTYADYKDACVMHNVEYTYSHSCEASFFQHDLKQVEAKAAGFDLVFICNPNNPTGALIPAADLENLCRACPKTFFVIDESYLLFAENGSKESMMPSGLPNVIVLNSMSKIFRIPGLRSGFMIAQEDIIETCRRCSRPWSVNSLAQLAVVYLMQHQEAINAFIDTTVDFVKSEKKFVKNKLEPISGLTVFNSATSFMLLKLPEQVNAGTICNRLAEQKILIRNCSNFEGLSDLYIRISLKTREINQMVVDRVISILSDK